jgi:hypothetical protein
VSPGPKAQGAKQARLGPWAPSVLRDPRDLEVRPAPSDLLELRLNHPTQRLDLWDPLVLRAHLVPRAMLDRLVLLARARCSA